MVRPLTLDDVAEIVDLGHDSIGRLYADPEKGHQPLTEAERVAVTAVTTHALTTDPGSAFGIEDPDRPGGLLAAAVALRRGSLWWLQKLAVRPAAQGKGLGGQLLDAALVSAEGASVRALAASKDPKALRRYWSRGLTLEPAFFARGPVDRTALPGGLDVVDGDLGRDAELIERADVAQRGSSRLVDVGSMVGAHEAVLQVIPGRGYVVAKDGGIWGLAALDADAARSLLWAGLATGTAEEAASVSWLTARTPWATDVALQARLSLSFVGALGLAGPVGPLRNYVVNGYVG